MAETKKASSNPFGTVSGLILIGVIFWLCRAAGCSWAQPDAAEYAKDYDVPESAVIMPTDNAPHGCAFDDAPLGNKHCHWERIVEAVDVNYQPVKQSGLKARKVYVTWERVQD
jgi:hypothetical protein